MAFTAPDFLSKSFKNPAAALAGITGPLDKALAQFNCPKLKKLDTKQLNQFPGYKKSQAGQNGYP